MGLRVKIWLHIRCSQNIYKQWGWRLGEKKTHSFFSLKLQKCIMAICFRIFFGFMDILHINKQKKNQNKTKKKFKKKNYLTKENEKKKKRKNIHLFGGC